MKEQIMIAGFGGQGILLTGIILANAGMTDGKEVSWMPSYGPEMRGGTANCHVTISDKAIGSPIIEFPDTAIVMNKPSLDKFEKKIKPRGTLLVNSSLAGESVNRSDIDVYYIPANDLAIELGNNKVTNIVMLGAYIKIKGTVNVKEVERAIKKVVGERKPDLVEINILSIRKGMEYIGGHYEYTNS